MGKRIVGVSLAKIRATAGFSFLAFVFLPGRNSASGPHSLPLLLGRFFGGGQTGLAKGWAFDGPRIRVILLVGSLP